MHRIPLVDSEGHPGYRQRPARTGKRIIAYSRSAEFSVAGAMRLARREGAAKTQEPFLGEMFGLCHDFRSATLT
jgi:hypothetical protein